MNDADIRKPFLEFLSSKNNEREYRIIPEMGICDGFARADIAVISDVLCGYEIKSDVDTLERLPSQVEYYSRTFDYASVVVGEKFKGVIAQHVPAWWGIYCAHQDAEGTVVIEELWQAEQNKHVDAMALLELLWRDELYALLKECGIKGISGKNRRVLRKIAVDQIPFKTIKGYTVKAIRERNAWRQ